MRYNYTVFDMRVIPIPPMEKAADWVLEVSEHFEFGVRDIAKASFESPIPGTHAYTVAAVLASSHIVVHTAPEDHWVEVAIACCKEVGTGDLLEKVKGFWKPEVVRVTSFTGSAPHSEVP